MSFKNYNIDILVISCDSYSDVWPYFFNYFFEHWDECPLDIYLLSNEKSYNDRRIKMINVKKDISWSDNLSKALKLINSEYVMLFMDDLLITNKISNDYFFKIKNWIDNNKPEYLKLNNSNKPEKFDDLIGKIPKKSSYKTSTMPSVWKKEILKKLLKKGESAWEFESKGSLRAYDYNNFFSVNKNFINYKNSIIKGKWQKNLNLNPDINKTARPVMNIYEQTIYNLKVLRSKLFNFLPAYFRILFRK